MNRLINTRDIIAPLNKCYLDYAEWPITGADHARMNAFKYYMEANAGLRLSLEPKIDKSNGQYGFSVERAELIDEQLYLVWTLKWA